MNRLNRIRDDGLTEDTAELILRAKTELQEALVKTVNDLEERIQKKYAGLSFGHVRIALGAALVEVGVGSMIESVPIQPAAAATIRREVVHYVRCRVKQEMD